MWLYFLPKPLNTVITIVLVNTIKFCLQNVNMNTFFTSDQHFFHKNVIKHCNRTFESLEEMHEKLIKLFNQKVSPGDITYHLGDFSFSNEKQSLEILEELNGKHYLMKGNHDGWLKNSIKHTKILAIKDYIEIKHDNQHIVMSHYPFLTWNRSHHGSICLHGHCHGNLNSQNVGVKRLDIGVDSAKMILGDYVPFSITEVKELLIEGNNTNHH